MRMYYASLLALVVLASNLSIKPTPARTIVLLTQAKPVLLRLDIEVDGKNLDRSWQEFTKALFQSADRDRDGFLDKSEAELLPPPAALFGTFNAPNPNRKKGMDADGNGKVTPEELTRFLKQEGASPFHIGSGQGSNQWVFAGDALARGESASDYTAHMFALLDADKNNRLSAKELESLATLLSKKDADDDEIVSAEEVRPDHNPSGQGYAQFVVVDSLGYSRSSASTSLVLEVVPGKPSETLAKKLVEQYRRSGERRPQRTVSRTELGLNEKAFAELDSNKDSNLDATELARFALRPPDMEITLRLGKVREGAKRVEVTGYRGKPVPADSVFTKIQNNLVMRVGDTNRMDLAVTEEEGRSGVRVVNAQQVYERQFQRLDRDNNKYLDEREARGIPFFSSLFPLMDADGDGQLFLKEVKAYVGKLEGLQQRVKRSSVTLSASRQGRGFFDLLDGDHDGRLSTREMRLAPKLLATHDLDKDGSIAKSEIPINYRVWVRLGGIGRGGESRVIALRAGVGGQQRAKPKRPAGPLWFEKMDRNADGDVSRREFLGPTKAFADIDTDGDALISLAEAKQADAKLRKR